MDRPEPVSNAKQMGKMAGTFGGISLVFEFAVLFTVSRSNFWR
jgi:hypothetical protein